MQHITKRDIDSECAMIVCKKEVTYIAFVADLIAEPPIDHVEIGALSVSHPELVAAFSEFCKCF